MAKLNIKVSKAFANFINKTAKTLNFSASAEMLKMTERGYALNVGSYAVLDAEMYGDYDWKEDRFKVIRIVYPEKFYALPKFITTQMLLDECKRYNPTNEQELMSMIRNIIEI